MPRAPVPLRPVARASLHIGLHISAVCLKPAANIQFFSLGHSSFGTSKFADLVSVHAAVTGACGRSLSLLAMCSTVDISDVVGHKHIEQGTSHGKEGFVGEHVPIFCRRSPAVLR